MELALNIAWLLVAAGLLLLCGARVLSFTQRRRRVAACIALACVIWLLFPVISITDDLSAGQSIFQATAVKKSSQFNELARGLITALPVEASVTPQTAWREINLHADLSGVEQEFFAFDLSRRPPPNSL